LLVFFVVSTSILVLGEGLYFDILIYLSSVTYMLWISTEEILW